MKKDFEIKRDKYKSSRGGGSKMLDLHCRKCNEVFAVYQKDGPGNLRRMYMDRVLFPEKLVGLQKKAIKDVGVIKCEKCGFVVGVPYVYKKENRKAFRVFQDAIMKKVRKKK
jgi:hypothetical protein